MLNQKWGRTSAWVPGLGVFVGGLAAVAGLAVGVQAQSQVATIVLSQPGDENPPLQILAGQSQVIRPPWPVARVSVTDPSIADVQALTPEQVLVLGKKPGSTDLVLWSQDERIWRARVDVGIDVARIKADLERLFPGAELDVTVAQNVLVVSGLLRRVDDSAGLRSFFEKTGMEFVDRTTVAGVQQVLIRVRVAEVQRAALRILAADTDVGGYRIGPAFSDTSTGTTNPSLLTAGVSRFTGSLDNAFGLGVSIPEWKIDTFIQALQENNYLRVLAEPSLKCVSGEEATFLAGGEFPIPVVQGGGAVTATTSTTSITIEYKEFGVRLRFKPYVLGDNTIRLLVAPEVSELTETGAVNIQGFRIPAILTRRAETTLELKSGQTFSLAGLISQRSEGRNSRAPLLGDLPVLGTLFRSVRYQAGETELVVMVTADLVEPMNVAGKTAVPGSTHSSPNDWELYSKGMIDGNPTPRVSAADCEWMKSTGMNRLRGPGAWSTHDQAPASSTSNLRPNDSAAH
ncbi:MAG TPA: type II and III secretion system protein family protein [Phycisphaerales bacterium]|nr:type II and III secretion system protein family protein [Phycisphaerales bacterium]